MVVIVNFGIGNIGSIAYKLADAQIPVSVSSDAREISAADRLVLPGVGHFGYAMNQLKKLGLLGALNEAVIGKKTPIFGICLGFQLFATGSEEGDAEGLGWIDAAVRRFSSGSDLSLRIPHVGWSTIRLERSHSLFETQNPGTRYYFSHSYYMRFAAAADCIATAVYGETFAAAAGKDNIFGTQFHPEKSHRSGFELLRKFAAGE
jgi:glutamine amidotransferase